MTRVTINQVFYLLAVGFLLAPSPLMAGLIEGRLFDGPASTAKIRVEGFGSSTWNTFFGPITWDERHCAGTLLM